jgi:HEAT repeat protein
VRRAGAVILGIWLAAAWAAAAAAEDTRLPGEVIRYSGGDALRGRLSWALGQAAKSGSGRSFWVGYSIRRLMGEDETIGSFRDGVTGRDITIAEILAGKRNLASGIAGGEDVRRTARKVLEDLENPKRTAKKVPKDVGIFLSYDAGRAASLTNVELSNLDLAFDFRGRDVYWLGEAGDTESLDLIRALFGGSPAGRAKEALVAAAGLQGDARLVVPFLGKILEGGEADKLRKEAAFWIGQQDDAAGLGILIHAAESDRSREVREGAVFAVSQVELPEAVDALINLARTAKPADTRKQAVFWIGQMASKKAGPALEDFARNDGDIAIQEQAVFALSELPDGQGVEPLIKLARTHPDPRVRKKAVFWLGECHDPRALDALIGIIKGK